MTKEPGRWWLAPRWLGAPLALLLALLAGGANAQTDEQPPHERGVEQLGGPPEGRRPPPPRRGPPPLDRVLEENAERLGLTEETREEIRARSVLGRDQTRQWRGELRTLHDEMRELLGQEAPDESAVMAQAERIGALETTLQKQRLSTMLAIRAMLTPEQRSELVRIHEERKAQRGPRRARPGGGRRGPPPPP